MQIAFPQRHQTRPAFTLVEIMIVVVIIGLLMAIAVPSWQKIRIQAQNARLLNDYRQYTDTFKQYNLEYGEWPQDRNRGVFPPEMEGYLRREVFTERNFVNGVWDWEGDTNGVSGLTLREANVSEEQMLLIDRQLDDGNLSTGMFVQGAVAGSGYTYIIERMD